MATIMSISTSEKAMLPAPRRRLRRAELVEREGIKDILNIIKAALSIKTSQNYENNSIMMIGGKKARSSVFAYFYVMKVINII
jgi:hypothetical protein